MKKKKVNKEVKVNKEEVKEKVPTIVDVLVKHCNDNKDIYAPKDAIQAALDFIVHVNAELADSANEGMLAIIAYLSSLHLEYKKANETISKEEEKNKEEKEEESHFDSPDDEWPREED